MTVLAASTVLNDQRTTTARTGVAGTGVSSRGVTADRQQRCGPPHLTDQSRKGMTTVTDSELFHTVYITSC